MAPRAVSTWCAIVLASSRSICGGAAGRLSCLGGQGLSRPSGFFRARQRIRVARIFHLSESLRSHTLFAGVEHLPPASILTIDAAGERRETYWDYDFSKPEAMDPGGRGRHARRADGRRGAAPTRRDVPVGAYLSGGMDSGAIVGLASRSVPRLQTFTAGFELSRVEGIEASFDERRASELMAYPTAPSITNR